MAIGLAEPSETFHQYPCRNRLIGLANHSPFNHQTSDTEDLKSRPASDHKSQHVSTLAITPEALVDEKNRTENTELGITPVRCRRTFATEKGSITASLKQPLPNEELDSQQIPVDPSTENGATPSRVRSVAPVPRSGHHTTSSRVNNCSSAETGSVNDRRMIVS